MSDIESSLQTGPEDKNKPTTQVSSNDIKEEDPSERYRREFLSQFSAEDDRKIMRKVNRRFLLIMGFMYLIKQIDYTNAAAIKVLQVGEPSNVLTELGMSTDQYNWVQTVYFVCPIFQPFLSPLCLSP